MSSLSHAARPSRALAAVAIALFAVLGLGPVLVMFERLAGDPSVLTSILDGRTLELLARTALLGFGASAMAFAIGVPFGFLVARTNVIGASIWRTLGIVPILVPPIILAMTWTMVIPMRGPGMCAFILGLSTFPLVALFTARAAERIDARREEAARLVDGNGAVLRLAFSLVLPSALGASVLAFVVAINDFALTDYVSAVGKKFNVYAGEVFSTWQIDGNEPRAVATALPLIALTLVALIPLFAFRRKDRSGTIDGDFVPPAKIELGSARLPATLFCALVVTLSSLVPIGRLVYESGGGSRVFSGVSIRRSGWTQGGGAAQNAPGVVPGAPADSEARRKRVLDAQEAARRAAGIVTPAGQPTAPTASATAPQRRRSVDMNAPEVQAALAAGEADDLSDKGGGISTFLANINASFGRAFELSRESLASSLLFAFFAATIAVPIGFVLGHVIQRGRFGRTLQSLALLPLVVPATLYGIGTIVLWNHDLTARVYDSGALVTLLFVGRFVAIPVLILAGAVASFSPALEESARLAGAGPVRRLFGIVAPGVWPSLVGSWIAVFALSVRELDAAVLVPAANDTAMFRVFNAVHFGRDDFVSALALLVIFAVLLPGALWTLFAKARLRYLP